MSPSRSAAWPVVLAATLLAVGCSSSDDAEQSAPAPTGASGSVAPTTATPSGARAASPFAGELAWIAYQTDRTGAEGPRHPAPVLPRRRLDRLHRSPA